MSVEKFGRAACIALFLGSLAFGRAGAAAENRPLEGNTLLAVFAHPDDEQTVAPMLARYARQGARVVIVIATDGRYGVTEFSGLGEGEETVQARAKEMECAATALGVELVHLDYHDQLKAGEGYDGHIPHVRSLLKDVATLVQRFEPDAIVTWGPDGGSNHMDHRLIGATVTGVYLSKEWEKPASLYFYGTPASQIENDDSKLLRGVADRYMNVALAFEEQDLELAKQALRCHRSQYTDNDVKRIMDGKEEHGRVIYLRKFEVPGNATPTLF